MFKIVRKADASPAQERVMRVAAVVAALAASALVLALLGFHPIEVYAKIVEGSLLSGHRLVSTLNKTIPLVVLSLGVAIAFKMKFWNIGAEGQFYMGAFGASLAAFSFYWLPAIAMIPLMMVSAFVFGGLLALIPAVLKSKFSTSETLVTLMLNYIAIKWITYLQYGPWKDPRPSASPRSPSSPPRPSCRSSSGCTSDGCLPWCSPFWCGSFSPGPSWGTRSPSWGRARPRPGMPG